MMTPEEQALEQEYFPMLCVIGWDASYNLKNNDDTFNSFATCESCWAIVNIDHTVRHARWHEKIKEGTK